MEQIVYKTEDQLKENVLMWGESTEFPVSRVRTIDYNCGIMNLNIVDNKSREVYFHLIISLNLLDNNGS